MAKRCKAPVMTWPEKIRFTRSGPCGEVLFGPAHQYVTSDFQSLEIAQDVTEGETWSRTKANGGVCCSVKRPDRINFDTWTLAMCTLDPRLLAAANETYKALFDYSGKVAGHQECYELNARNGLFAEPWINMCSTEAACDATDTAAGEGLWLWMWGGKLRNIRRGDLTLSAEPNDIQIIGTTESGHQWGRGPIPMMYDTEGNPAVLPQPLDDCARFATMETTMPPPDDTCGWEPLSNPNGPKFTIECVEGSNGRTLRVRLVGDQTGTRLVDFGDGSAAQVVTSGQAEHTFTPQFVTENGETFVAVWDPDRPQLYTATLVTLPCKPLSVVMTPTTGPAPLLVTATVSGGCDEKPVAVWGDR